MHLSLNAALKSTINTHAIAVVVLLLSSLGLVGCSEQLSRQTCVELGKEMRYCLAPMPQGFENSAKPTQAPNNTELSSPQSFTQKVSIRVGDESHELLTQLELDAERMTLVGLAPLGQALFTLVYDGHTLSSEQNLLLGNEFKAEYLMAMMQLIYWPEQSIRSHLTGAKLVSDQCTTLPCRQFYPLAATMNKQAPLAPAIQIHYQQTGSGLWQSHINLAMPQARFELDIQPM